MRATKWNREHPERRKETRRRWEARNPDKVQAKRERRLERIRAASGQHTHREWLQLCHQHHWTCGYCAREVTPDTVQKDHIVALSAGGTHDLFNILPSCPECNARKGGRDVLVFLKEIHDPRIYSPDSSHQSD